MRWRDPQTYIKLRYQTGNLNDRYEYNFYTCAANASNTFSGYGPTLMNPDLGDIRTLGSKFAHFQMITRVGPDRRDNCGVCLKVVVSENNTS